MSLADPRSMSSDAKPTPGSQRPAAGLGKAAPREKSCVTCGGEVAPWETECGFCTQARGARSNSARRLLLHWLVFLAAMLAVFATGWVLTP